MEINSISNKHHFKKTVQKLFYLISGLFYFYLFLLFGLFYHLFVIFQSEFYNGTSIFCRLVCPSKMKICLLSRSLQRQLCQSSCDEGIYQLITFYTFLRLLYICVVVKILKKFKKNKKNSNLKMYLQKNSEI